MTNDNPFTPISECLNLHMDLIKELKSQIDALEKRIAQLEKN